MATSSFQGVYEVRKAQQPIVPKSDEQIQKTRQNAGFPFNPPSMMAVFMFVLVLVTATRMRPTIVTEVVTNRTASRAAQPRASTATELSTDHIAERAAQAATHSGGAITSGHRPLCYQQAEKQCR
jgi:hypothetical protein